MTKDTSSTTPHYARRSLTPPYPHFETRAFRLRSPGRPARKPTGRSNPIQVDPALLLEKLRRLLGGAGDEGRPALHRIAVRSGGRIQSLRVEEIHWFEAADNYLRIHTAKAAHLIRETLSALERRLDPSVFIRIHRSAIVQIESIREVESLFHGDYEIELGTGERLPVGRKYRDRLVEAMGGRS